ncbi:hypothetical protein Ocin01_14446 [Orchesella cincta]|uniref:Uncharacterized protein n=1 Tax=Orchesella cincta TaxID=48709 RepID=A0A1D2MH25_ORCCI|nr:hypothetical protein Ocin01_14446 [Orchesella cincta]
MKTSISSPHHWPSDIRSRVPAPNIPRRRQSRVHWMMISSGEATSREHNKMVDIYEALNVPRTALKDITPDSDTEEQLLQRAIEESLMFARQKENPDWRPFSDNVQPGATGYVPSQTEGSQHDAARRSSSYEELQAVLDLSRKQLEEEDKMRREEEENLKKVLELSLKEQ